MSSSDEQEGGGGAGGGGGNDSNRMKKSLHARRACILCREMTKKYEQVVRGTVASALQWLDETYDNKNEKV